MSPRPILRPAEQRQDLRIDVGATSARTATTGPVSLARRSARYTTALARLDAGNLQPTDLAEVMDALAQEYPIGAGAPLGMVAECLLGEPYEVHILDLVGGIVEHFERGRAMPPAFERARTLANHPAYLAIEIYQDTLVCVRADGSISELKV